jgi:DNA repair protein RecO (recombination protein O)
MKKIDYGFVINRISYSETSLILRIFTLENGLKPFLFQGAKKKKGYLVAPLSPLEFSYYQRNDSSLAKMTEASLFVQLDTVFSHPIKSGLLFFQNEVLKEILHEGVEDRNLFQFIQTELLWLEHATEFTNYPIFWLLELMKSQGFMPQIEEENGYFLDMENGLITKHAPTTGHIYRTGDEVLTLIHVMDLEKEQFLSTSISKVTREKLLNLLLDYYALHFPNFGPLKSIEVLESVWHS